MQSYIIPVLSVDPKSVYPKSIHLVTDRDRRMLQDPAAARRNQVLRGESLRGRPLQTGQIPFYLIFRNGQVAPSQRAVCTAQLNPQQCGKKKGGKRV